MKHIALALGLITGTGFLAACSGGSSLADIILGSTLTVGPAGSDRGTDYDINMPNGAERIKEIRVWSGDVVDGFQVIYEDANGTAIPTPLVGRDSIDTRSTPTGTIQLGTTRRITRIRGSYNTDYITNLSVVASDGLSFSFGTYNGPSAPFRFDLPQGAQISGFYGRESVYLASIGIEYRTPTN